MKHKASAKKSERRTQKRKPSKTPVTPPHWQKGDTEPEPESPAHMAKCGQCQIGVKFRPSATGAGFTVLERYGVDVETTFGVGENARPLCPNGHGEMVLADESLPAPEAIAQVAEKVNGEATQLQLLDMAKPFNAEGAWADVAQKADYVSHLEREHKDDAERSKRSKKALEEEEALLRRMIATYEGRRQQLARDAERRAESADGDAALASRLSAIGVVFDVASLKALPAEERIEIDAWVADAERMPHERARWAAWTPRGLGKGGGPIDGAEPMPAAVEDAPEGVPVPALDPPAHVVAEPERVS